MGRCILVFCLPRSGSSALAGALHRMGVDMGEGFLQKPDALNPRGYYEDLRWHAVNKALSGYGYAIREPVRMTDVVEKRINVLLDQIGDDKPLWGLKSPRLAFTATLLWPYIRGRDHELCAIVTHRPIDQVVDSMRRHSQKAYGGQHHLTQRATETMITRWKKALTETLSDLQDWKVPFLTVEYDDLIKYPHATMSALWPFVHPDKPLLDENIEKQLNPAAEWIDPEMRHFK